MLNGYYTGNPVADAERFAADMEAATEQNRRRRVVKCTATLWMTVDHATGQEAEAEAYDFFSRIFAPADDAEFTCKEDDA